MILKSLLFFFTILFIYVLSIRAGEIHWNFGNESGIYKGQDISDEKHHSYLTRFDASLSYKVSQSRSNWSLQFRLKPEFYSSGDIFSNIKFFINGQYLKDYNRGLWSVSFDTRKFNYYKEYENFSFDIINFSGYFFYLFYNHKYLFININYLCRDISNHLDQNMDTMMGEFKILQAFSKYMNAGFGGLVEKFLINQPGSLLISESTTKNKGWRFGPEFSLEYQKKIIISFVYKFLFHQSDITENPSYQNQFRFLFSKLLSRKWSLFLLADYYLNKFSGVQEDTINLLYTPVDNANNLHVKIVYDIKKGLSIYSKLGYVKDNLIYQNFSIQGWQSLIGIKFEK